MRFFVLAQLELPVEADSVEEATTKGQAALDSTITFGKIAPHEAFKWFAYAVKGEGDENGNTQDV